MRVREGEGLMVPRLLCWYGHVELRACLHRVKLPIGN